MLAPPKYRALIDPELDMEAVRRLLDGLDLRAEELDEPAGADVVAVVTWNSPIGAAELDRLPALRLVLTAQRRPRPSRPRCAGPLRRVRGTRLGVVGCGRIGRAVIARAHALGFEVWAADAHVEPGTIAASGARPAALDAPLGACHALTLHVPLSAKTAGLIGARELDRLPRGGYLVNTARGKLVDTDAVLRALADGRLAGAALDVLPVEPPTAAHPAPRAPNLIVTPHAAYASARADVALLERVAAAIRAAVRGETPTGALVTPAAHQRACP